MLQFIILLALVAEFSATCRDRFHEEVEPGSGDQVLLFSVERSAAGFYLGFFCPICGPYDRLSGYYRTREEAEQELEAALAMAASYYEDVLTGKI